MYILGDAAYVKTLMTILPMTLRLCLITHESGTSLGQTSSRFKSVLIVGFASTAGLFCDKKGQIQPTGFRFAAIKQGLKKTQSGKNQPYLVKDISQSYYESLSMNLMSALLHYFCFKKSFDFVLLMNVLTPLTMQQS